VSILKRILGGDMSESVYDDYPELAKEWASAQINMPREAAMVNRVGPMGLISRNTPPYKDASGVTGPMGTIAINRKAVTEDKNLKEVLQHELTHAGAKPRGITGFMESKVYPWAERPEEKEAIAAESKFQRRMSDIYLPSEYDKKKKAVRR
jgi:hypothetical protein